jgi:hypothetical protein
MWASHLPGLAILFVERAPGGNFIKETIKPGCRNDEPAEENCFQ